MEFLQWNSTGLLSQMLRWLLPMPDPQTGDPDVGFRTFTPMVEPLQYNYFFSLWVDHLAAMGDIIATAINWFYCDCVPPIVSLRLPLCLWTQGIVFGRFQCFFFVAVDSFPAVSSVFGVFMRGGEHTSFYYTIFSPLSVLWFLERNFNYAIFSVNLFFSFSVVYLRATE